MSFLLDTNILSAHLRRPSGLSHHFNQRLGRLFTSTLNLAELYVWVNRSPNPTTRLNAVTQLLKSDVGVVAYDQASAEVFGRLRTTLFRLGTPIDPIDLLIASCAIAHDLTLVTHNIRHFQRISNLRIEDWLTN